MTRLLVSVRSVEEALLALDAGVDWIDIKEPAAGSLGAASPETIATIVEAVGGRCPVSAALGELVADAENIDLLLGEAGVLGGLTLVKIGLAGATSGLLDWKAKWQGAVERLPTPVGIAAVAYADWETATCPAPADVIVAGRGLGCSAILLDTFDKRLPGLFQLWSSSEIAQFLDRVRDVGLRTVLAGKIFLRDLPAAQELAPDLIAVRGAVCAGDRAARLCANKLATFVGSIRSVCFSPRVSSVDMTRVG